MTALSRVWHEQDHDDLWVRLVWRTALVCVALSAVDLVALIVAAVMAWGVKL